MSDKTRKVQWQVSVSVDGKQWPLLIETEIPVTPTKFKEALALTSKWLLACNLYPWLGRVPLTDAPPGARAPMKERDAIQPPLVSPDCPLCKKEMLPSKHQDQEGVLQCYCAQRTDNSNYCLWRGHVEIGTGAIKTWKVKP